MKDAMGEFSTRFGVVVLSVRRQAGDDKGATMVEFALSSIILFSFVVGIMVMSQAIYSYHAISEVAREGTRYAVVRGATAGGGAACTSFSSSNCVATKANISDYVNNFGLLGKMTVTTTWSAYTPGASCVTASTCNYPGDLVTVAVQYTYPVNIPFVPHKSLTLNSSSSMVISQ